MTAFFIALTLLCFVLMFIVSREYKLAIMFMATMLLSLVILPFKGITALMVITLGFLLSEAMYFRGHWRRLKVSALFPYLILVVVSFVLAAVTSPHLHNINDLGYFALSEVMVKQFAIIYGFMAMRRRRSIRPLLLVSLGALILMTVIGYANFVSGSSFMVEELYSGILSEYDFTHTERFRVQATFLNPFDYGFMCVLLAVLHVYGYLQKMEDVKLFAVAQACCLFGVIACNCRTILFCYAVCALVFAIAIQKQRKHKLYILLGAVALSIGLILFVPGARRLILSVLTIFDPTSVTKGSSLAMRLVQLSSVIFYISASPLYLLLGRGVHFFELDLGWENGSVMAADSDLYGLEGIYLNLLLERGVLGFAIYLAMMLLIAVFIFRHRKLGRKLYALGITVFALYILFSFMTGELLSATPSFYILGYVIANQTLRQRIFERRLRCRA